MLLVGPTYEAYWPRPYFWRNGRAADESLGHPLAPQLLGSCIDEVESGHVVVVVGGLASRRLVGASQLRSTPGNHVPFNCSITDVRPVALAATDKPISAAAAAAAAKIEMQTGCALDRAQRP